MTVHTFIRKIQVYVAVIAMAVGVAVPTQLVHAAAGYCGDACNGKLPSSSVGGVVCKNTKRLVGSGSPHATYDRYEGHATYSRVTEYDTAVTINVKYSSACQTLWGVVVNQHASVPTDCFISEGRTIPTTWYAKYTCPGAGSSVTTPMVNDHSPTASVAGYVNFHEVLNREVCTDTRPGGLCAKADPNSPVSFGFTKAY